MDFGFSYDSIIDRGDITTEEMAQGYYVKNAFSIENGDFYFRGDVTGDHMVVQGLDYSYVLIVKNGEVSYQQR